MMQSYEAAEDDGNPLQAVKCFQIFSVFDCFDYDCIITTMMMMMMV